MSDTGAIDSPQDHDQTRTFDELKGMIKHSIQCTNRNGGQFICTSLHGGKAFQVANNKLGSSCDIHFKDPSTVTILYSDRRPEENLIITSTRDSAERILRALM
jgi:hypothetical protein